MTPASDKATRNKRARMRGFAVLAAVVVLGGVAFGSYWLLVGAHRVSTDNAYVDAEIAQVTPTASGIVREISVQDTQQVRQGDTLVKLDDTDAVLALARAEAQRQTAQTALQRAQLEFARRRALASTGAVSAEELGTARSEVATTMAALAAAEAGRSQAAVDLSRTVVVAPIDGVIARRTIQLGQQVQPGMPMMTVVPLDRVYVNANFKEVQLRHVRVGQPVELTADLYGDEVVYHGVVDGLSGGTGAAFSAIPAQNATGNWIKVVQRLPVRVRLDPKELRAHPLQVGLSMEASIDISQR